VHDVEKRSVRARRFSAYRGREPGRRIVLRRSPEACWPLGTGHPLCRSERCAVLFLALMEWAAEAGTSRGTVRM
jgi:hypothetical protein